MRPHALIILFNTDFQGWAYAGLVVGDECNCGNNYPSASFVKLDDSAELGDKCHGDKSKVCGGVFKHPGITFSNPSLYLRFLQVYKVKYNGGEKQ